MAKKKFWIVAIAGGGSGGQNYSSGGKAGGGGAGEYYENTEYEIDSNIEHILSIGLGGNSVSGGSSTWGSGVKGNNGQDTSFGSLFTLKGGGGGGNHADPSLSGGSGGGASLRTANQSKVGGSSIASFGVGNKGGDVGGGSNENYIGSGGGGGAGSAGGNGTYLGNDGDGGNGISSEITGTSVGRAGGGGGAGGYGAYGLGKDGGGDGGMTGGGDATPNTGAGGGGRHGNNRSVYSGGGGSGIIILRFKTADIELVDTTGATISTVGDDTVLGYKGTTGVFKFKILAEISTQPLSNLTYNSVVANANFSKNESIVSERGFCYSETPNPTTSDNKKISSGDDGAFSETIGGLSSLTTYYIKSYAILDTGTIYGNELVFNTPDSPSPKITEVTPAVVQTDTVAPIEIIGQNFLAGATVEIGGVPALDITVQDSSLITCFAPSSSVQKRVDLIVENPDTKKASSPFYYMEQIPPIPPEPSITASFSVKGVGIAK